MTSPGLVRAASGALLKIAPDGVDSAHELEVWLANTGDIPIVRWRLHVLFGDSTSANVRVHASEGKAGSGVRVDRTRTPGGYVLEPRHPATFRSEDIAPGFAQSVRVHVIGPPCAPSRAVFTVRGADGSQWRSRVDACGVARADDDPVSPATPDTWPGAASMDRVVPPDPVHAMTFDEWWPSEGEEDHAVVDEAG